MKKISSIFFFLLLVSVAYSQTNNQSLYFKAGASFPLLDLSKGNIADTASGMATTGIHVEVGYTLSLTNHFGLGIASYYYGNRYSQVKFVDYYKGLLDDASHSLQSTLGWSTAGVLLKPYYAIPIGKNISWDIYVSSGLFTFQTPKYRMATTDLLMVGPAPVTSDYYRYRSKGISFAYGFGSRVNFKLVHRNLFVDAGFLYSKIRYSAEGIGYNNRPYKFIVHQKLGYLSVNFGYTIFL